MISGFRSNLCQRVEELLREHEEVGDFLDISAGEELR